MNKAVAPSAGARRRQQILREAFTIVVEHGQLTVQMVADRVKVTDAAVLYHFRTKEALLVELMRFMDEAFETSRDDLDEIDRAVLAMRDMRMHPNIIVFFQELASRAADEQHPAHEYFNRRYDDVERRISEAARKRLPELTDEEIAFKVRIFLAATDGFQRRWLVQRDFDTAEHSHAVVVSLFGPSPALEAALGDTAPKPVLPFAD